MESLVEQIEEVDKIMPLPKPKKGEEKDDFIKRCMGNDIMKREFKDKEQRVAVCYNRWRE